MENILSFSSSQSDIPAFLITYSEPLEHPFFLTPQVMSWSQKIWIHDLRPTTAYWKAQFSKGTFKNFIDRQLQSKLGNSFQAIYCDHPWQGLILLETLPASIDTSLIFSGPLGQRYFKDMSWHEWMAPLPTLFAHFEALKTSCKKSAIRSKMQQMTLSMKRLGVTGPGMFKNVSSSALTRRFGKVIGDAWRWTIGEKKARENVDLPLFQSAEQSFYQELYTLEGFPWQTYKTENIPQVSRSLEYSLNSWEPIEVLLREDLERLCQSSHYKKGELLNELEWSITLHNLKQKCLSLPFRNPHDLRQDGPSYSTALTQFFYSYESLIANLKEREDDLDLPPSIPIISWTLSMTSKMTASPQWLSLMTDHKTTNQEKLKILDLENKLPISMSQYRLNTAFDVGTSFELNVKKKDGSFSGFSSYSWQVSAQKRPLFVYSTPKSLSGRPHSLSFLERTHSNWWQESSTALYQRDYFQGYRNKQRRWIYRDGEGHWFEGGLFD